MQHSNYQKPQLGAPAGARTRRPRMVRSSSVAAAAGAADAAYAAQQEQLLHLLNNAGSLEYLQELIDAHPAHLVDGELGSMALLAVAQMQSSAVADEDSGKADDSSGPFGQDNYSKALAAELDLQEQLLDRLVEGQLPRVRGLPLRTMAALVLALANVGYYHPGFYAEAAAGTVDSLGSLAPLEVPVVATVLAAGFSAAGHYEEPLFDALAAAAVRADAEAPAGPAPLLAVTAAMLEVQHYCRPLLDALVAATRAAGGGSGASSLPAVQLVDLLLVLAFFRAAPADIVDAASLALARPVSEAAERLRQEEEKAAAGEEGNGGHMERDRGEDGEEALDGDQLQRLLRAAMLLVSQGVSVGAQLADALAALPPGRLLGADHLVSDPEAAEEALQQPQGAAWEAAGLLAPAQVVMRLEEGLGYEVAWDDVAGDGPMRAEVDISILVGGPAGPGDGSAGNGSVKGGRHVAVAMLDEESCHCAHPPGRLRGGIAVQVLALQSLGWVVAPLPVREWCALKGDVKAQDAYLQARIAAAIG